MDDGLLDVTLPVGVSSVGVSRLGLRRVDVRGAVVLGAVVLGTNLLGIAGRQEGVVGSRCVEGVRLFNGGFFDDRLGRGRRRNLSARGLLVLQLRGRDGLLGRSGFRPRGGHGVRPFLVGRTAQGGSAVVVPHPDAAELDHAFGQGQPAAGAFLAGVDHDVEGVLLGQQPLGPGGHALAGELGGSVAAVGVDHDVAAQDGVHLAVEGDDGELGQGRQVRAVAADDGPEHGLQGRAACEDRPEIMHDVFPCPAVQQHDRAAADQPQPRAGAVGNRWH
ncbi:hypothetical protein [Arthrobacter sp. Marseille-P9274]|uniref:hypothetical protein n=1 Tax=Arthrobacter sp. Marseille-P9274 TaxID=2866572 RepID=UPI0021C8BF6E|nr:hypothetical protein [Arthrobacter sp. Marseille-P9274]